VVDVTKTGDGDFRPIPVSSVVTASLCPMRLYLDSRSGESRFESPKYTICKQVSSHLGQLLDPLQIWKEVVAIAPDIDPAMYGFMESCIARCNEGGPWPAFAETDVYLRSEMHDLAGNLDKLLESDPFISIVRAVRAPAAGVYSADRLRVFGYMLLVSEVTGREVSGGMVEYIPSGVARPCTPQPLDKRRFFKALADARAILSGDAPPRPTGTRCRACESYGACSPPGRRLSDIL